MQGNMDYYSQYAENLASWGFAVLQYDAACPRGALEAGVGIKFPCLNPVDVQIEVRAYKMRSVYELFV